MLMSDSLGGSAKTLMFVNVSPSDSNIDESSNSLQYATRVRTIKNDVSKNEASKDVMRLKRQVGSCTICISAPSVMHQDMLYCTPLHCRANTAGDIHFCPILTFGLLEGLMEVSTKTCCRSHDSGKSGT